MYGPLAIRWVVVVAAACRLSCACAAADFQAAIAELDRLQPNSPAALAARLDYGDFLLETDPGPCRERPDLAQAQVDGVAGNAVMQVVFPDGWARLGDLQYRIYHARAACDTDPSARAHELQAALVAAQRAVQLYRDALDYRSMAVMQYNVAAGYRALGDSAGALTALEAAITLDKEFGLRADAQDNYATLLRWRKEPAGPEQVARHMVDFPNRATTLKFAWTAGDAAMTLQITHASIVDGEVIHANASRTYLRQLRAADEGWVVSYTPADNQADPGPWPQEVENPQGPLGIFRPTLLQFPTLELAKSGTFKGAEDLVTFAARLTHEAQAAIRTQAPAGTRTPKLIDEAAYAAQVEFAPAVIGNEVSETYGLETAMWIDATLTQGVSYELTVPLSLAGIPHVIVEHRLQFVFTREVPCSGASAVPSCVELVVRATPLEQPLKEVLTGFQLPQGSALHYASSIAMRLIVDPKTLQPYLRDTHRYWYVTVGKQLPDAVMMESDHSELNFVYR